MKKMLVVLSVLFSVLAVPVSAVESPAPVVVPTPVVTPTTTPEVTPTPTPVIQELPTQLLFALLQINV
jgi:hypothetical protein